MSHTLAGRTMIRAYCAELEAGASFDDVEARLAAIARVGVHEIIHDRKWLDWDADVSKLRQLGVRVQQLAETTDRSGHRWRPARFVAVGRGPCLQRGENARGEGRRSRASSLRPPSWRSTNERRTRLAAPYRPTPLAVVPMYGFRSAH
jgi:hypothetical protein